MLSYLIVVIISMIPLIELRGAIPVALAPIDASVNLFHVITIHGLGLPVIPAYITAVIGNMIPVPFIYLFARRILEFGADKPVIGPLFSFMLNKGKRGGEKLMSKAGNGLFVALLLFVGIPLPGTGAWTGTLAASILDMDFKNSVLAVLLGVLLAGIIMGAGTLGLVSAITTFLG